MLKNIIHLIKLMVARFSAHFFFANEQKRMKQLVDNNVSSLNSTRWGIMQWKVIVNPQLKKTLIFLVSFFDTRIENGEDPISEYLRTFPLLFDPFGCISSFKLRFIIILSNLIIGKCCWWDWSGELCQINSHHWTILLGPGWQTAIHDEA